jgi:hypothetical protein
MFRAYPAHLQEVYVVIVYICSLWYRQSLQVTVWYGPHIYDYEVGLLMLETCRGF